jgi:hypothetical protein
LLYILQVAINLFYTLETSQEDVNSLLLAESNLYKKDAQFIQDAYYKVKQEMHINHPLWSNIQVRDLFFLFFFLLSAYTTN